MAGWQARIEPPITYDYGRYRFCNAGAWSQGPVMLQQLALLKDFDLDGARSDRHRLHPSSGRMLQARLCRPRKLLWRPRFRRSAGRDAAVGRYNEERRKLIGDTASLELRPGTIAGFGRRSMCAWPMTPARGGRRAQASRRSAASGADETTGLGATATRWRHAGDTVHFDIIDRDGNMVSSTPSGGWLQSSPVIPELGFCLGTRAQMFWLDEEHPAALAPGKRPRTTLSPTLALRDGEPYLAWGSPGGDQQDQWIDAVFPAPRPCRHEPAGGDRRAGLALRAFPVVVLAAQARPGVLVVESRVARSDNQRTARGAAMWSRSGRAWSEGRLTAASRVGRAAAPPPIRAACRATPPDAERRWPSSRI